MGGRPSVCTEAIVQKQLYKHLQPIKKVGLFLTIPTLLFDHTVKTGVLLMSPNMGSSNTRIIHFL